MNFIIPSADELSHLRADPLLWEQELDSRVDVATDIEKSVGFRAGRTYWRSVHGYLYALELGDLGRGRPSIATVFGFWDRYEPRPPDYEIDADLVEFLKWFSSVTGSLNPADFTLVIQFAQRQLGRINLIP